MQIKISHLKRVLQAALLFLLLGAVGMTKMNAQSTVGTDFWVTFLPNHDGSEVNLSLIAAGSTPCSGTITNPYTNWSTEFEVSVGATTIINIPLSQAYSHNVSDSIADIGLHVVTTDSISLYASNFKAYTFDVTDVLPTSSLGTNYIVQTYNEANRGVTMNSSSKTSTRSTASCSEFSILAVEDNTTVLVTLTDNSSNGHYADQPFSVTLNAGQCFQIKSVNGGNFSGSQVSVNDNKKVAVFAGNLCTTIPFDCGYCDHVVEQMMPVSCWGNHFVVTNSSMRYYDVVRVTSASNDCQIFINGSFVTTINQNQTYQFEITDDDPSLYLETSEPVMVYLYYVGSECAGQMGDPSMVMISPIEQRMNYVTFSTFNSGASQYHYVNVVANTEDVSSIQLDGNSIFSEFQTVSGNSDYSYARVPIAHGSHTLSTTGSGFVAHVYGLGDDESYAYSVGSRVINLSTQMLVNGQLSSDFPEGFDVYKGEPVNFDLNVNFDLTQANWTFGDGQTGSGTPLSHQYDNPGNYTVSCDVYRLKNGQDTLVATVTAVLHVHENNLVDTIPGLFSVSEYDRVYFSPGNLQYQASTGTWRFAENQWDYVGNDSFGTVYEEGLKCDNLLISPTYEGWIDLFCWGTSGYDHGAVCYQPWSISGNNSDYYAYGNSIYNLNDQTGQADWGYNAISNGGNQENQWHTLTREEAVYVFNTRNTLSGIRYAKAMVNEVNGLILLPDAWDTSVYTLYDTDSPNAPFASNQIDGVTWTEVLEPNGAVFLPVTFDRMGTGFSHGQNEGLYWLATVTSSGSAYNTYFHDGGMIPDDDAGDLDRQAGRAVRLVRYAGNTALNIDATPYPVEGGTVSGGGLYNLGTACVLTAMANDGYTFTCWTENGELVSTQANYSFIVARDRSLVANFIAQGLAPIGAIDGLFSVSDNTQVYFSQGNLQYIGSAAEPYWKFADNQWDCIGNAQDGDSQYVDRDLFGFSSNGIDHGANCYQPWSTSTWNGDYYAYGSEVYNLFDQTGQADWGYNPIVNGGNQPNLWRTLTREEWVYIFNTRNTRTGVRFARAVMNGVNGVILPPDNWNDSLYFLADANQTSISYSTNEVSLNDWVTIFEPAGAVFLPAAGYRSGSWTGGVNENGDYWSSSVESSSSAYILNFQPSSLNPEYTAGDGRFYGRAARLVRTYSVGTSYQIQAEPNPTEGGTVTGTGMYQQNQTCTLTATANAGYAFVNWTEDGEEVSTEATYSFIVTGSRTLVANFASSSIEHHWTFNPSLYENNMNVLGVVAVNGEVLQSEYIEVGAFCNDECRGSEFLMQVGNQYLALMTIGGQYGDLITFRAYDHQTGQEIEGTCSFTVEFESNALIGSFDNPVVFDFVTVVNITQTTTFNDGWTWWSTYIETTDNNVLDQLKDGLGTSGIIIKSQAASTMYMGNNWIGTLNMINEGGYMLKANAEVTVDINGPEAMPENHPITLQPGWTWIGYPSTEPMSVEAALANMTPQPNDVIKGQAASSMYMLGQWRGSLTLTPGIGLMYKSNSNSNKTLTYATPSKMTEAEAKPIETHWDANYSAYPTNMTVLAVVELDGEELNSEQYELAAFANGECRSSVAMMYVEPLDRYMALLTISGEEADNLHFGLYNTETGEECFATDETLTYETDAVIGSPDEPFVIRFRNTTGVDEWANSLQVFPNPVEHGQTITFGMADDMGEVQVEIINALGMVETRRATSLQTIAAPNVAGVYTLRITVEGKGTCYRKLIVR